LSAVCGEGKILAATYLKTISRWKQLWPDG